MKTKTIFMLAAMLLMSMSAFAQSNEPLEGDVNKDGKVDVADIVKVIDIMAAAEQPQTTVYYWYAGQTNPENMTEISPILSGENEWTSGSGWHALGETLPESIDQLVKGGTDGQIWYAAIPVDAQLVAGSSADPDTSVTQGSIVTIPRTSGIQYQIWVNEGVSGTRYHATFNR